VNLYVKLSGAVALLVAGFGLARLMGEPDASERLSKTNGSIVAPTTLSSDGHSASAAIPLPDSDARLVPDFDSTQNIKYLGETGLNELAPPLLPLHEGPKISNVVSGLTEKDVQPVETVQFLEKKELINTMHSMPRAKLRNEAPRPVVGEPYEQDFRPPTECVGQAISPRDHVGTTVHASYLVSTEPDVPTSTFPPLPWPGPDEEQPPRTHIVVDGDSLPKLAARYLGDARRAKEIHELNRELLADPELLPIGLELAIPPREGTQRSDQSFRQTTVASAVEYELVPVSPSPSVLETVPRAQLLRPTAAD